MQQYSRFKDASIRPVVIGNSKQFFVMRQFDRNDVDDIARDIALPESVCASIQNYPMPEQQPAGKKFSSLCFSHPSANRPFATRCATSYPPQRKSIKIWKNNRHRSAPPARSDSPMTVMPNYFRLLETYLYQTVIQGLQAYASHRKNYAS